MLKLLIGGSPCTNWSIAQKNNREIKPEGIGWELFKNYLIAKEKFKPDLFLYENNKSAAQEIKDQIAFELGVGTDPMARFTYINSALVSAQNRQRFYVTNFGDIEQPEDRGILLRDILENGIVEREKAHCLKHRAGNARDYFKRHHTNIKFEPVTPYVEKKIEDIVNKYGYLPKQFNPYNSQEISDKVPTLTTCANRQSNSCTVMNVLPIRVGTYPNNAKNQKHDSKQYRIYSADGKSTALCGNGGGIGAKTGLYAIPVECLRIKEATKQGYIELNPGDCFDYTQPNSKTRRGRGMKYKSNCCMTSCQFYQYCGILVYATPCEWDENGIPTKAVSCADGKTYLVYEVRNGQITIKDKQYPIKLIDGHYIIRKLTVTECCRLQTLPDDYCKAVSPTQAYKGLGNGWTAEVIIHLLNHALKDVPRDEEIVVLSLYDGIGTGRYCLDKMGFTNVKYYAYEIDKFAMTVANDNYSDIIQCGDAFAVRNDKWNLGGITK